MRTFLFYYNLSHHIDHIPPFTSSENNLQCYLALPLALVQESESQFKICIGKKESYWNGNYDKVERRIDFLC